MKPTRVPGTLIALGGWGIVASVLFALLPLGITIAAGLFGSLLGCEINEAGTSVCLLLGADIGGILSTIGLLGWFALITFPLGALAGIISLGLLVTGLVLRAALKDRNKARSLPQD